MFHDDIPSLTDNQWQDLIVPLQPPNDIYQWMQVSRAASLFYRHRDTWKKVIAAHSGIPHNVINDFEKIVYQLTGAMITDNEYRLMYGRLHAIRKSKVLRNPEGTEIHSLDQRMLANPAYYLSFLACSLDNVEVARTLLRKDLNSTWHAIAIRGDCVKLVTELFPRDNENVLQDIKLYLAANASAIVQHVIVNDLKPTMKECMVELLTHGKQAQVEYLLSHLDLYNIRMDFDTFDLLIKNNNLPLSFIYSMLVRALRINPALQLNSSFLLGLRSIAANNLEALPTIKQILDLLSDKNVGYAFQVIGDEYLFLIDMGHFAYFQRLREQDMIASPLCYSIVPLLARKKLLLPDELTCWLKSCGGIVTEQATDICQELIKDNQLALFIHLLNPENGYQLKFSKRLFACSIRRDIDPAFLSYLLQHCVTDECRPDQKTLDHAIKFGKVEHVCLLLEPALGLRPTVQNLKDAIAGHRLEILQILLDKSRGFELALTLKMLAQVNCFSSTWHPNSKIPMAQYMLQPEFGLQVTQEFMDDLFVGESAAPNDPAGKKSIEFLLFILDTFNLRLTQERFEFLFLEHSMYYLADLPTIRREQFSHLRATSKMLNLLIDISHEEYIHVLLQPHFGLVELVDSLNLALDSDINPEIVRAIAVRCNAAPALKWVAKYAALGDVALVEFILAKYKIKIDETILEFLFSCTSFKNVLFVLDLAKKANVIGTDQPFRIEKNNTYQLEGNLILLDPQYNLQFMPEHLTTAIETFPDLRGLFDSDFAIKRCLNFLNRRDNDEAQKQFAEAYKHSPIQCVRVATYAICHPAQYHISTDAREVLLEFIRESLTTINDLSITEQLEISSMVRTTHFVLLDGEYFGQQLAHQLVPR